MPNPELENILAGSASVYRKRLRGRKAQLVAMRGGLRIDVELPIVKKMDSAQTGFDRRFENVPCVLHSVHVADLVAVVCRNRQLGDPEFLEYKLNDDLGVEMELACVFFEWDLGESSCCLESIAGMKFGEICSQHSVLECGQNLIPDPFVKGHSAPPRRALVDHARTKNCVGLTMKERTEERR